MLFEVHLRKAVLISLKNSPLLVSGLLSEETICLELGADPEWPDRAASGFSAHVISVVHNAAIL